jgi:hypothetical protein
MLQLRREHFAQGNSETTPVRFLTATLPAAKRSTNLSIRGIEMHAFEHNLAIS